MATVFLNGAFLPQDEARISAFDAGFQHGVGLFETMLGGVGGMERDGAERNGPDQRHEASGPTAWVFRLGDHLDRLIASARELGLAERLDQGGLAEAVLATVERSELARARVRLTVSGGDLNLLGRPRGDSAPLPMRPTVLIVAQPATEYPESMFEHGVTATVADARLNPLDPMAGHKTLNYWGRLRELQAAAARGAGEALVFQVTNHLAGGCVSNAFIVRGGEVFTPIARGEEGVEGAAERGAEGGEAGSSGRGVAVPSPVLPGITRRWLLEWAGKRGLGITRRMLTITDVLEADEVFLTNSSWGVLPVVRVEKEAIADGEVGEITAQAREAWLAAAEA